MVIQTITCGEDLDHVQRSGLALLHVGAPWSAACLLQGPILRRLAARFDGRAQLAAINIDERHALAGRLNIHSIPTLLIFRDGREVRRLVGLRSEAALAGVLTDLLGPTSTPPPR